MKIFLPLLVFAVCFSCSKPPVQSTNRISKTEIPDFLLGSFEDDYGIKYVINDSVWKQGDYASYAMLEWNEKKQFLIVRNADKNPSDAGLYSRIDYMKFQDMEPYTWGFCLSLYNAATREIAEDSAVVDRLNPKTGCNGYPFSRMKKIE